MAKRSGKSKAPKAKQLREVGQKAKVTARKGGPEVGHGDWVVGRVRAPGVLLPAFVLTVDAGKPDVVQLSWPNERANNAADARGGWNRPLWAKASVIEAVGVENMTDTVLRHLAEVIELRGMPEGADAAAHGVPVWREMAKRGLKTPEDEKDGPGEPDAGDDDQAGSVAEAAVEAVREHGQPREGDEDQDSCTVSVNGGEPVATNLDGMKRTAEALEAKAGEGTKPSGTVHVEIDRPIGRLVGEHADLQGVRLLHDPKTEEAWALASNGAVMAAMPVMMTLPELGAAPAEADVVPGEAAMGKAGKPRALELRAGRPQGLFDTGVAWVSSLENRWWGTWKPTRACWMADALPNVPANGQGVVAVRLRAEQLADLAKVVGDEQGGVTLLLDVAELGKAQPGVEGEKAKVRVGVVGENETGVGAPVGVLMMEVQGSGACKRYSESHGRLLRLTAAPRNQLTGKMD